MSKGVWAKNELMGEHLINKILGIIGMGNIGTLVGKMRVAWGMKVFGCVEFPDKKKIINLEFTYQI